MTLGDRLSAFFVAIIAVLLCAFSAAIYVAARVHLFGELETRLDATLDTLEASIDVEPGGLEWEPQDRKLNIGIEPGLEHVRWVVTTEDGQLIDSSANAATSAQQDAWTFPADWSPAAWPVEPSDGTAFGNQNGWRLAARRLLLPDLLRQGLGHPEDDGVENDVEYPVLIITAGLSPLPAQASLNSLSAVLIGLTVGLWLVCASLGRWLSRFALAPISRLADATRTLKASDAAATLPSPGTHDELEQLGIAMNDLLHRLHALLENQNHFASDASHQLRTPLAGLLSLVEVTRRRPRTSEEYERTLDQIHKLAVQMRQIVESLLVLARTESDTLPLESERVDLGCWLRAHLQSWGNHSRAADLQFDHPRDEGPWIKAHTVLLGQIVDNLLDNAAKYSEPGTPIIVRIDQCEQVVQLSVADSGRGIPRSDLRRLFEPFYRGSSPPKAHQSGVGLGLSIVHKAAKALGAAIVVRSQLGHGTQFTVNFTADENPGGAAIHALDTNATERYAF